MSPASRGFLRLKRVKRTVEESSTEKEGVGAKLERVRDWVDGSESCKERVL